MQGARLTTVAHNSHEFEWKREECYMLRKPDPPVLVAITKEPAGRIKTKTVQILDYNLNRCVPPGEEARTLSVERDDPAQIRH